MGNSIKLVIFGVVLLFAIIDSVGAQTPQDNLSKYWNYRQRLIGVNGQGGFVSVGQGQGMSLPASERYTNADCARDYYIVHTPCKTKGEGKGRLHWGDCSLYLGYYIATLALEYANLEAAGYPVEKTAEELWYALEAFERIDSMAEVVLGLEGKKNGFFLRDDVPFDFYIQNGNVKNRRFAKDSTCINCVTSALACKEVAVENGSFISQDQVLGLFIGFSFVEKLLTDKKYRDTLPTFGEKAVLNTHRIASYMADGSWKLRDPNGNDIPDKWGGNAIGLSYPIGAIADEITKGKYEQSYIRSGAGGLGLLIFDLLKVSLSSQNESNVSMALSSLAMLSKTNPNILTKRAMKHDMIMYALLHVVLHNKDWPKKLPKKEIEALINSAPFDGPCFNTPGCNAPDGWKSYDRWIHASFKNGNPYTIYSETHGIDFMILYNLYHYYFREQLPEYKSDLR